MALCLSFQEGVAPKSVSRLTTAQRNSGAERESAAEYLNRHAPKRNPDKILTLAGYLKEFHNKDTFQQGEIKESIP